MGDTATAKPTRKPRNARRGLGKVPKTTEDLFRLASRSALLVAQGKMSAVEGKAVADLVNRAGQLSRRLEPDDPSLTATGAKGMPLDQLLATVQELAAKLQPGATPLAAQKPTDETPLDLTDEPAAGPGVAKVLELLKREEPAA